MDYPTLKGENYSKVRSGKIQSRSVKNWKHHIRLPQAVQWEPKVSVLLAVCSPAPCDDLKTLSHDRVGWPTQILSPTPQTYEFTKGSDVSWPLLTFRCGRMGTERGHGKHSLFDSRRCSIWQGDRHLPPIARETPGKPFIVCLCVRIHSVEGRG